MLKVIHLDTETTGQDADKHSVHQIAGSIEINNVVKTTFDYKVRPFPGMQISAEALKMSGVTLPIIFSYPHGLTVIRDLCRLLDEYVDASDPQDKMFICGYNVSSFDQFFLKAFFKQNSCSKYSAYFYNTTIDTMVLAAFALRYERAAMPDFTLAAVAKRFNIDVDLSQLHNGGYDAEISRLLYHKLSNSKT